MERLGFDMSQIPKDDKQERNTQIGKLMRDNPRLTAALRNTTESTISSYLTLNGISEDDLILRAYDGFVSSKLLEKTTSQYIPLELRHVFEYMVIASNRQKFIAWGGESIIKGVPHRYEAMDKMFTKLLLLRNTDKEATFTRLQKIKDEVVIGDDKALFCIPIKNKKFIIFLKGYGETEISESLVNLIDISDIDKQRYYDFYLRPFCESIVLEEA